MRSVRLRWFAGVPVFLSVPFFIIVAAIGLVADDMTVVERVLLCVVNPVAIGAAAWALGAERVSGGLLRFAGAASAVALVANVVAAVSILIGSGTGDAEVPLVFALPFVCWLIWFRAEDGAAT